MFKQPWFLWVVEMEVGIITSSVILCFSLFAFKDSNPPAFFCGFLREFCSCSFECTMKALNTREASEACSQCFVECASTSFLIVLLAVVANYHTQPCSMPDSLRASCQAVFTDRPLVWSNSRKACVTKSQQTKHL